MEIKREYAGRYEVTVNGTKYAIVKLYRGDTMSQSNRFWTWYEDDGMTGIGNDSFKTLAEATEALKSWTGAK